MCVSVCTCVHVPAHLERAKLEEALSASKKMQEGENVQQAVKAAKCRPPQGDGNSGAGPRHTHPAFLVGPSHWGLFPPSRIPPLLVHGAAAPK